MGAVLAGLAAEASGEGFGVVEGAASGVGLSCCAALEEVAPAVAGAPGGVLDAAGVGIAGVAPGAEWSP